MRRQRPLDVVELGQQRLRRLRRRLADQADDPAAPALVEQDHAADARGGSSSSRAMRLRISSGSSICASARVRLASNAKVSRGQHLARRAERAHAQAAAPRRRLGAPAGDHQALVGGSGGSSSSAR